MNYRTSGVYAIKCVPTSRVYIGSSVRVSSRWAQHRWALRHGKHWRPQFQADWDEHGESAFEFTLLAESDSKDGRHDIEQQHMDAAKALGLAYNSAPRADGNAGMRHTSETRQKVASAGTGRVPSAEARRNMSRAQRGRTVSDAGKANMSLVKRGSGNYNAKLTEDGVREIKRRLAAGERCRSIARDFDVDPSVVGKIRQGRRWTHVTI